MIKDIITILLWAVIGINILFALVDALMYSFKKHEHFKYATQKCNYEEECNNIKTGAIHHLAWAILALLILK